MDEDCLQIRGGRVAQPQLTNVAGEGPMNVSCTTIPDQANGPNTRGSTPLTDLGTIPNPFTPALGATAADNANITTECLMRHSRCTELERENASLLEEYALKDLEQHAADLRAASTSRHAPVRPTHNRGPSLEALADPLPPKRA
jgi:hypothetical protein